MPPTCTQQSAPPVRVQQSAKLARNRKNVPPVEDMGVCDGQGRIGGGRRGTGEGVEAKCGERGEETAEAHHTKQRGGG